MIIIIVHHGHRAYISAARRIVPSVPRELEEYIATAYSSIRQDEAKSNAPHSYTTVRTLLSILRISIVSSFIFSFFFILNQSFVSTINKMPPLKVPNSKPKFSMNGIAALFYLFVGFTLSKGKIRISQALYTSRWFYRNIY